MDGAGECGWCSVFFLPGMILSPCDSGGQVIKCSKAEVRRLKTALRWKIPSAQRERIQMVLGGVAEHGEPCTHGL